MTAFATEPSVHINSECQKDLLSLPNGHIPDFNLKVVPPFTMEELVKNRQELTERNSKYILGETGATKWVVEDRIIKGRSQPQIVAVKYFKGELPNIQLDVRQLMTRTQYLFETFERLGLLKYFDVLVPLEVGDDYAVFPLILGNSLANLTLESLRHLNPPKRFLNPNVRMLGPPTFEQDYELAKVWSVQQVGSLAVLKALKAAGARVEYRTREKSWSGVSYFSYAYTQIANKEPISLRPDVIVTTDGRLVIVDAE